MYDFSTDLGPDTLDDVVPTERYREMFGDGPVPIRHIPMPERLAELIGLPGGFASWASEMLGCYEALWSHGVSVSAVEQARTAWEDAQGYESNVMHRRVDEKEQWSARRDAALAMIDACGGDHALAARALSVDEVALHTLLRKNQPMSEPLRRAIALVDGGMGQRAAAREVGVSVSTLNSALMKMRARPNVAA